MRRNEYMASLDEMIIEIEQTIQFQVSLQNIAWKKIYDNIKLLIPIAFNEEEDSGAYMEIFGSVW